MIDLSNAYLTKAVESLAGAESEFANGRYNNCGNRCYYACFQAAIAALIRAGVRPIGSNGQWGHEFVQARFSGELVRRRKVYAAELRDVLAHTLVLRHTSDYEDQSVTETAAYRALRRVRSLVEAIRVEVEGGLRGGG